jgi:glutathione S-transferase
MPIARPVTLYGDRRSGNCLKVRWTLEKLNISYTWVEIDVVRGQTRTTEFLQRNPAGQVPVITLPDGPILAQSNAIMIYFAEGSDLIPTARFERAKMFEWLFWEQYSHEPYIAVARFQMAYQDRPRADLDPKLFERGAAALARMEDALATSPFLVGDAPTLADIALVAYTRVAHEGGFDITAYPRVDAWVARVEAALPIEDPR